MIDLLGIEPRDSQRRNHSMEEAGQKLKRARERLNLRYRDVEEASNQIAARHNNDEFVIALSRLSDIENLKCKFEQSLSTRFLARILGVECEEIRELARAGHLRTRWRPAVDGYNTMKFDRDSVVELLNSGLLHTNASQARFLLP